MAETITNCRDCLKAHQPIRVEYMGQHLVCSHYSMRVPVDSTGCPHFSSATELMNQMDKCLDLATKILEKGDN